MTPAPGSKPAAERTRPRRPGIRTPVRRAEAPCLVQHVIAAADRTLKGPALLYTDSLQGRCRPAGQLRRDLRAAAGDRESDRLRTAITKLGRHQPLDRRLRRELLTEGVRTAPPGLKERLASTKASCKAFHEQVRQEQNASGVQPPGGLCQPDEGGLASADWRQQREDYPRLSKRVKWIKRTSVSSTRFQPTLLLKAPEGPVARLLGACGNAR